LLELLWELPMGIFRFLAYFILSSLVVCAPAHSETRVALIIGMSKYQQVLRLTNPTNDAQAVADLFNQAGFDAVKSEHDLGIADLRRVVREFSESARNADIAVVYYAGHGMEVDGNNYLVPIDAKLLSDFDVEDETISLDRVLKALEPAKRLKLVILDACRDNPFAKTMKRTLTSRSIGRGLAEVEPGNSDTLIAFAAKAGAIASDGDGKNSPFATALLKHLTEPGLDLRIAFGRVRDDVLKSTGNRQEPFVYGSLGGDTMALVPAKAIYTEAQARVDYELAAQIATEEAWASFLAKHSSGYFSDLARAQTKKIAAAQEARAKADDARRDAEAQAAQKAAEYRKQLEEQNARETEKTKQKLSEQAKKDLEDARRQLAEQAKKELEEARRQVEILQQQADAARLQVEAAKRQSAADAKVQVEQSKPPTEGDQKLVALSPDSSLPQNTTATAVAPMPQMDPSDVARLLQAHLKRVGCNSGQIDGNWDDNARNALALFNQNAHTSFDVKLASLDALEAVRGKIDRVCPLICGKGRLADGERCRPIGCSSGFFLSSSGECEKRSEPAYKPREAVRHETTQIRPATQRPGGGGKCFSFNGKTYCE
jgi:uncharacterized caspase-like protein